MLGVLFGLFYISSLTASEWIYYKHYPWVYDHISEDWLYLRGVDGGKDLCLSGKQQRVGGV